MKLISLLLLALSAGVGAAPVAFQSSGRQTALLELYTSEGCSSCPPAEAWLTNLKNSPGLWREFVPVALHVDYWNSPGWKDKWSDAQFSERQQDYAQRWSAKTIYTPEFVLNGQEWRDWLGLRGAPSFSASQPGVLRVSSDDGGHWSATFVPAQKSAATYEISAAVLASDQSSDVKAGENSGRHLNHDFAALSLITRPLTAQTNGFRGVFISDSKSKNVHSRLALAVWVTLAGRLEPLQATGGWLPGSEKLAVRVIMPVP